MSTVPAEIINLVQSEFKMGDFAYNKIRFKENEIAIVPVGDLHLGSPSCDYESIVKLLYWLKETPNTYILGMGDYCNFELGSHGVGELYSENLRPEDELEMLIGLFKPVKNKIIGLHSGQHELRIFKATGIDPMKIVTSRLGVKYYKWTCLTRLIVGRSSFDIFSTHGSSYARTTAGKMNACKRYAFNWVADVYVMGHVHVSAVERDMVFENTNSERKERKRYYVLSGSFLKYVDSYAEYLGLPPSFRGVPKMRFWSNGDFHVSI